MKLDTTLTFLGLGDATSRNLGFSHCDDVWVSYGEETTFGDEAACVVPIQRPTEAVILVFASGHGLRITQAFVNTGKATVQEGLRKIGTCRDYSTLAIALSRPTTFRSSANEPGIVFKSKDVSRSAVCSSSLVAAIVSGGFNVSRRASGDRISSKPPMQ